MMGKIAALLLVLVFLTASCIIAAKPALSSVNIAENSWASKASMPTARASFGVAVVDGKIYAIGGGGGANEVYDPVTDSWATRKPMPNPRTSFAIAACENKIYVIGGYDNTNEGTAVNEVYDPRTDSWETRSPMPTIRGQLKASVVNGKIYVIGGILEGGEILSVNEAYDPATDTWTTKSPTPYGVYSHSSVVVDNRIYVISGQYAIPGHYSPEVGPLNQIYNPETDTWTLGAAPLQPAHRAGAVATSGELAPKRIYVVGGEVGFMEATNINQVYDPQKDTWSTGAPMPTARQSLGVAVVNDLIYALGGNFPANGFSTTTSGDLNKRYTTLGNSKVTPINFVPQETCGINEQYTPIGYGTPDPSYVPPSPTPTQSQAPPQEPVSTPSLTPFATTLLAASTASVTVIGIGLLVYFKKRKR
jgi:N-acetylneuraminic acid mutarotase